MQQTLLQCDETGKNLLTLGLDELSESPELGVIVDVRISADSNFRSSISM